MTVNKEDYKAKNDAAVQKSWENLIVSPFVSIAIRTINFTPEQLQLVKGIFEKGFNAGAGHAMCDVIEMMTKPRDPTYNLDHSATIPFTKKNLSN